MKIHTEKSRGHGVSAPSSKNPQAEAQIVDRRPASVQMRQMQAIAHASPRSLHVRQLQARANAQASPMPDKVMQRYAVSERGWKVSQNQGIIWEKLGIVYAGDAQFEEANGIDGDVVFVKGAAHANYPAAHLVIARPRPGSRLEASTREENKLDESAKLIIEQAKKATVARIQKELYAVHEDEISKLYDADKNVEARKLEKKLDSQAKERAAAEFGAISDRVHEYIGLNGALSDRPLMPSDCRALSTAIAGFDPGSGEETDETAAGVVYEIKEREGGNGEWPYHYATIIMTDGPDHLTMENAAAKVSDGFSKMQYDKSWTFKMYGPDAGQSFNDEFAEALGH